MIVIHGRVIGHDDNGIRLANRIIGQSLRNNEDYLRYLWIHNLESAEQHGAQIIYVPTEANLPILEASRLMRMREPTVER